MTTQQPVPGQTPPRVKPGQMWVSTDRRESRRVKVLRVCRSGRCAEVEQVDSRGQPLGGRRTEIRIVRGRLNRYRLDEGSGQ